MIGKRGSKHVVMSETTGRRFGTYDTSAEAKKRLYQIEGVQAPQRPADAAW